MKKVILMILIIFIFIPSTSFAFDICGWWQSQKYTNAVIKITDNKIAAFDYKIISETDNKIEMLVDKSKTPSFFEKKNNNIITFTNTFGEKTDYKLVTRDTNLKKKDVRKLCGID